MVKSINGKVKSTTLDGLKLHIDFKITSQMTGYCLHRLRSSSLFASHASPALTIIQK